MVDADDDDEAEVKIQIVAKTTPNEFRI